MSEVSRPIAHAPSLYAATAGTLPERDTWNLVDAGNRARQALKMAAMALCRSESALGAFYRRLCARMDKPKANTATAHKLARMVYFMLTRGEAFVDQGQQRYEEQQRQRSIAALKRRAAALGFHINPVETVA
jgi:hypothetical protein